MEGEPSGLVGGVIHRIASNRSFASNRLFVSNRSEESIMHRSIYQIMTVKSLFFTVIIHFIALFSFAKPPVDHPTVLPHPMPHPFHLGLVEVHIDRTHLEIAIRVFTDDLEWALGRQFKKNVDLTLGDSSTNFWLLSSTLRKEIQISADSRSIELKYVGCEREDDSIWLYMEHELGTADTSEWTFVNTLLTQDFPEQRYVVSVSHNGRKKTQLLMAPDFRIQWSGADF